MYFFLTLKRKVQNVSYPWLHQKGGKLKKKRGEGHAFQRKGGWLVFLGWYVHYIPPFSFPTRSSWAVITHLNSFIYVTFLVNIYCLPFLLKMCIFKRKKKKITLKKCLLLCSQEKPWDDPKGSWVKTQGQCGNCPGGNLLKCNQGHQERDEEGGRIWTALFPGYSYRHSLPVIIPKGLENLVPPG